MSGEPKFTPGPWSIVRYCEEIEIANIADIMHFYGGEAADANAALIAAAPELYAALENMVAWASLEDTPRLADLLGAARAALAKARGE